MPTLRYPVPHPRYRSSTLKIPAVIVPEVQVAGYSFENSDTVNLRIVV